MLVSTLVSVVSEMAANEGRSIRNRPTSSAAKCCESAALPPLPNTKILQAFCRHPIIVSTASATAVAHLSEAVRCSAIVQSKMS